MSATQRMRRHRYLHQPRGTIRVLLLACTLVAGCTSPEAERTRGGGPGADTGNRPEAVRMHGGSDPFWMTPGRIGTPPPLTPAHHARQVEEQ